VGDLQLSLFPSELSNDRFSCYIKLNGIHCRCIVGANGRSPLQKPIFIIESLQNVSDFKGDRSAAIKRMRGLLTTNRPAPTDEEVSVMLEERLTEKYS
jgi:hypothetical protein